MTGRMGRPGTWGEAGVRERTSAGNWRKPIAWAKLAREGRLPDGSENVDGHAPRVFCASLADVFEPRPELDPWRYDLFDMIEKTPELAWLVLTKRPDVARDWLRDLYDADAPRGMFGPIDGWTSRDDLAWGCHPNLWIGTSIENSRFTWRADALREIPASVRFISAEPLLGSLFQGLTSGESPDVEDAPRQPDPGSIPGGSTQDRVKSPTSGVAPTDCGTDGLEEGGTASGAHRRAPLDLTGIDWVIVGGESGGRNARPMHPTWVREIRAAVLARAVPEGGLPHGEHPHDYGYDRPALHLKQWGSWAPAPDHPDSVWVSPDGRVRSSLAADVTGDLPDGSMRMRYVGAAPKSGGKRVDGVEWCEFPDYDPVLAPF